VLLNDTWGREGVNQNVIHFLTTFHPTKIVTSHLGGWDHVTKCHMGDGGGLKSAKMCNLLFEWSQINSIIGGLFLTTRQNIINKLVL